MPTVHLGPTPTVDPAPARKLGTISALDQVANYVLADTSTPASAMYMFVRSLVDDDCRLTVNTMDKLCNMSAVAYLSPVAFGLDRPISITQYPESSIMFTSGDRHNILNPGLALAVALCEFTPPNAGAAADELFRYGRLSDLRPALMLAAGARLIDYSFDFDLLLVRMSALAPASALPRLAAHFGEGELSVTETGVNQALVAGYRAGKTELELAPIREIGARFNYELYDMDAPEIIASLVINTIVDRRIESSGVFGPKLVNLFLRVAASPNLIGAIIVVGEELPAVAASSEATCVAIATAAWLLDCETPSHLSHKLRHLHLLHNAFPMSADTPIEKPPRVVAAATEFGIAAARLGHHETLEEVCQILHNNNNFDLFASLKAVAGTISEHGHLDMLPMLFPLWRDWVEASSGADPYLADIQIAEEVENAVELSIFYGHGVAARRVHEWLHGAPRLAQSAPELQQEFNIMMQAAAQGATQGASHASQVSSLLRYAAENF